MIVVADTSPINYLALIGQIEILAEMFGEVIIPQAVFDELRREGAPDEVRRWLATEPDWLAVRDAQEIDPALADLDDGEREAISLAVEIEADLIILDENKGRRAAIERGLNITGTLGIIKQAAKQELIDLPTAVARLKQTNFRISPRLLAKLLPAED